MWQVYVCKSGLYLPCLRSFLLLAQFWHTWEKMHESSKIFVEHVQPVALVQLPTRPTSCALETAGSVMSIALSKNGYTHWNNQFHKRRQDWSNFNGLMWFRQSILISPLWSRRRQKEPLPPGWFASIYWSSNFIIVAHLFNWCLNYHCTAF